MRLLTAAALIALSPAVCLAARSKLPAWPGQCSAYSVRGDAATVNVTPDEVALSVVSPSGGRFHLSVPAQVSVHKDEFFSYDIACKAYFDATGRYLAVGFNSESPGEANTLEPNVLYAESFRIIVVDVGAEKMVSNFTVGPHGPLLPLLMLAGFLEKRPQLVILGTGPQKSRDSFSEVVLGIDGKEETGPLVRARPPHTSNSPSPDPRHNRLWLSSDPQYCPMLAIPLVGNGGVEASVASPSEACNSGDPASGLAYPDEHTVVDLLTDEYSSLMRIDLGSHKTQQIPQVSPYGGSPHLSPDGEAVGLFTRLLGHTIFGGQYTKGLMVEVYGVRPLRFLGKIRLGAETDPASVSIDHRNGIVTVLSYDGRRWRFDRLKLR